MACRRSAVRSRLAPPINSKAYIEIIAGMLPRQPNWEAYGKPGMPSLLLGVPAGELFGVSPSVSEPELAKISSWAICGDDALSAQEFGEKASRQGDSFSWRWTTSLWSPTR